VQLVDVATMHHSNNNFLNMPHEYILSMKKRYHQAIFLGIVFSLFILLSLNLCYAVGEELIVSKDVLNGEIISVQNQTLKITINSVNLVLVEHNSTATILNTSDCKIKYGIKYCLDSVEQDIDENLVAKMSFYSVYADMTSTLKASDTSIDAGDDVEFNFSIVNAGYNDATNVLAVINVSSVFAVQNYGKLSMSPGKLFWQGTIPRRDEKIFLFTLRANHGGKISMTANISFNDGVKNTAIQPSALSMEADDHLLTSISNASLTVGTENILSINYSNVFDSEAYFNSLIIAIPAGIVVKSYTDGVPIDSGRFQIIGSIDPTSSFAAKYYLYGEKPGNYTINVTITNVTLIGKSLSEIFSNVSFEVKPAQITFTDDVDEEDIVESQQVKKYNVFLINPYEYLGFENIDFAVNLDNITLANQHFDRLGSLSQIAIPLSFQFPDVTKTTNLRINFSIHYVDAYGQEYTSVRSHAIRLNPHSDIVIRKVISTHEFGYANSTVVQVYLKNTKVLDISGINVEEILSDGLKIILGNTKRKINLDAGEEQLAYTYTITAKSNHIEKNQTTMTMLVYQFSGKTIELIEYSLFNISGTTYFAPNNVTASEMNISLGGKSENMTVNASVSSTVNASMQNSSNTTSNGENSPIPSSTILQNIAHYKLYLLIGTAALIILILVILFKVRIASLLQKIRVRKTKDASQLPSANPADQPVSETAAAGTAQTQTDGTANQETSGGNVVSADASNAASEQVPTVSMPVGNSPGPEQNTSQVQASQVSEQPQVQSSVVQPVPESAPEQKDNPELAQAQDQLQPIVQPAESSGDSEKRKKEELLAQLKEKYKGRLS
jgi:hypothetical protein